MAVPQRCCICARHLKHGSNCQHCGRYTCVACTRITLTRNGQDKTCTRCAVIDLTVEDESDEKEVKKAKRSDDVVGSRSASSAGTHQRVRRPRWKSG
eukprot:6488960-Amphidinium_carterae.1